MLAPSLQRSPWRQEQLPALSVCWAENSEQTFPITSSRGRRLRQNPCPIEHHPKSQGLGQHYRNAEHPAVGEGGGRALPLPLIRRGRLCSDSRLRLQVPGPGWAPSLHQQCSLTHSGLTSKATRRVEKVKGGHLLVGSTPILRKRPVKREKERRWLDEVSYVTGALGWGRQRDLFSLKSGNR